MVVRETRDEALLKQIVLLALAHDFMSPFRALAALLENANHLLMDGNDDCSQQIREATSLITRIERTLLPTLAGLYNEVQSREELTFDELVQFMTRRVGLEIDSVVADTKIWQRSVAGVPPNRRYSALLREIDTVSSKIKNMLTTLATARTSAASSGVGTVINLEKTVQKAASIVIHAGARVELEVRGRATIHGNSGQIFIVISNLISNAVKYSQFGNTARVAVFISRCPHFYVEQFAMAIHDRAKLDRAPAAERYADFCSSSRRIERWVQVLIQDYGVGIPSKRIWGIFKAYKQLSPEDYSHPELVRTTNAAYISEGASESNYGFGLALCQYFVRLHEGELVADSREGGPTVFAMWLPLGREGKVKESAPFPSKRLWWERSIKGNELAERYQERQKKWWY